MMDDTTWMNAKKAIELGFADELLKDEKRQEPKSEAYAFSSKTVEKALINKISAKARMPKAEVKNTGRKVSDLKAALNNIKQYM